MKMRPKVGDRVEFRSHGSSRIGKVVAIAETDAHFLIRMPIRYKYKSIQIGIDSIIRILPRVDREEK
ncbi:hypothetical protein ES703_96966 [subsurface metagenome]